MAAVTSALGRRSAHGGEDGAAVKVAPPGGTVPLPARLRSALRLTAVAHDGVVSAAARRGVVTSAAAKETGGAQPPTVDRDHISVTFGFPSS